MLTIFRGDDLAFAEYDRKVCVRFTTCQDLTGWAAKFYLLDNIKQTNDISSRIWTFGYTAEETESFPYGKTYGKLVILDSTGQIRQIARVDVEIVAEKFEPCLNGFISISIDNVIADYNNMGNKPALNGKTIEGDHDAAYYGLASAEDVAQYAGLANTVQMMSATVTDQGEAIATNYMKLVGLQEQVDKIQPGIDYSTQIADLTARIVNEISARTAADTALGERIDNEASLRETAISNVINGITPITNLLFVADGDNENFYRIQVVLRDDGAGNLLPALALDMIKRDEESGSD